MVLNCYFGSRPDPDKRKTMALLAGLLIQVASIQTSQAFVMLHGPQQNRYQQQTTRNDVAPYGEFFSPFSSAGVDHITGSGFIDLCPSSSFPYSTQGFASVQTALFAASQSPSRGAAAAAQPSSSKAAQTDEDTSVTTVFFDVSAGNKPIGQLRFKVPMPSPLPDHAANLLALVKGSRRGIDPNAHYVGCQFDYSPATIQDGMGRYRWGHTCTGCGRNAVGRSDARIALDPSTLHAHTHDCVGGQYYGLQYQQALQLNRDEFDNDHDPGVILAVPVVGPGHGMSRFSIVRVGESPPEWGERLLLNCGVVGVMDPSSWPTLASMAQQSRGPPTITASGVLE